MISSGTSRISWNLRFHATKCCVSSNIATPSPMFSNVTRSSSWRWRISSSNRAFSIAITAWAAKFSNSAICLSENALISRRHATMAPRTCWSLRSATHNAVWAPPISTAARRIGLATRPAPVGCGIDDVDRRLASRDATEGVFRQNALLTAREFGERVWQIVHGHGANGTRGRLHTGPGCRMPHRIGASPFPGSRRTPARDCPARR